MNVNTYLFLTNNHNVFSYVKHRVKGVRKKFMHPNGTVSTVALKNIEFLVHKGAEGDIAYIYTTIQRIKPKCIICIDEISYEALKSIGNIDSNVPLIQTCTGIDNKKVFVLSLIDTNNEERFDKIIDYMYRIECLHGYTQYTTNSSRRTT